jgi:CheY-like chemotaxis protein
MDNALLTGKHILVVEDEMLVLMGLEDLLGDLGCTSITVAANVGTALELIAATDFDLATLDVNLSGTLSYPVAEALEDHQIPFAFSTGYGEHGVNQRYVNHPVLKKPFSRLRFEQVISALLSDDVTRASVN